MSRIAELEDQLIELGSTIDAQRARLSELEAEHAKLLIALLAELRELEVAK